MEDAGLEVEPDSWANLFGRLRGRDEAEPELWSGSHLDSVPRGGRFDGVLGVLAALEAAERLAAAGRPRRTVAVVAFRDEEGGAFARGLFGSRARFGLLDEDEERSEAWGRESRARFQAPISSSTWNRVRCSSGPGSRWGS